MSSDPSKQFDDQESKAKERLEQLEAMQRELESLSVTRGILGWVILMRSGLLAVAEDVSSLLRTVRLKPNERVHKPAGWLAYSILTFVLPNRVFVENFSDTIRDMRDEANEADAEHRIWKRRWIIFRDNSNLWFSFLIFLKIAIVKRIATIWRGA